MTNKQSELLNEFKKLIKIMDENKIWYSMTLGTLLGAWQFGGFIPWDDDIDILIDLDGFKKLKKLCPDNILGHSDKGYPILLPKWVPDKSKIHESAIFIDLFVVVQTDMKYIKKFKKFRNKFRFGVYSMHHNYIPHTKALKTLKVVTWPFKFFFRKNVDYDKWADILDGKGSQYYYMNNPAQPNAWSVLPSLWNKELIKLPFHDIQVNAVACYKEWLEIRYNGINMTPPIGKKVQVHTNVYSVDYQIYNG